ncbi:hypothetical protein JEZ13_09695 [bacterium]|nr:hypothetical protein [bacterium]
MEIKVLKAKHGDCIIIKWHTPDGDERFILIDSGVNATSFLLKKEFEAIHQLEAFILTHIDDDHIGGFLKLCSMGQSIPTNILKYFINTPELINIIENNTKKSISQANNLIGFLKKNNQFHKCSSLSFENNSALRTLVKDGLEIKVLSPNKIQLDKLKEEFHKYETVQNDSTKKSIDIGQDLVDLKTLETYNDSINNDILNDSSIVLLLEDNDNSILLLADSNPTIIEQNLRKIGYNELNPLIIDYVKLSHHGSKYSISKAFLSIIKSNNYIVSTNGGYGSSKHPDRETIAKIVCNPNRDMIDKIVFWFNYKKEEIEMSKNTIIVTSDEELEYNFECRYINEEILK